MPSCALCGRRYAVSAMADHLKEHLTAATTLAATSSRSAPKRLDPPKKSQTAAAYSAPSRSCGLELPKLPQPAVNPQAIATTVAWLPQTRVTLIIPPDGVAVISAELKRLCAHLWSCENAAASIDELHYIFFTFFCRNTILLPRRQEEECFRKIQKKCRLCSLKFESCERRLSSPLVRRKKKPEMNCGLHCGYKK